MITIFDIHKRIVEILESTYGPKGMSVVTSDKLEDIDKKRPCFKVDIEPMFSEPVMAGYDTNEAMAMITYFPSLNFNKHNLRKYNLREKLENMFDELNQLFAVNFLIKPKSDHTTTSLLVANKNYSEDTEGMHMTFMFDVSFFNSTEGSGGRLIGVNTDPEITSTDDLDLMQIVKLIDEANNKTTIEKE